MPVPDVPRQTRHPAVVPILSFQFYSMSTKLAAKDAGAPETEFLPLTGTDHIELYVGNAKQAAHFYQTAFAFNPSPTPGRRPG